jgi:hypothetical protein
MNIKSTLISAVAVAAVAITAPTVANAADPEPTTPTYEDLVLQHQRDQDNIDAYVRRIRNQEARIDRLKTKVKVLRSVVRDQRR